ncbi:MAG: type II toxin-antitoxin system VapC family toxin [Saprospiraceae bacterium]|nr:type II toxin-antitoxin system VapC family toxin [Saprospiraceae bacterium]
MIIIDTHILIWWVNESPNLSPQQLQTLEAQEIVAVSAISIWEIAKLVEKGRLILDRSVSDWIDAILLIPKIQLIPLTPEIIIQSTQLPGDFHNDPADQIIVATAIYLNCKLLTQDSKILNYKYVTTF